MTRGILIVNPDLVVKDGVETYILKSCNLPYIAKILTIAGTQGKYGSAGTKHLFPKMWKRLCGRGGVDHNLTFALSRGISRLCRNVCGGAGE
jgi:hypothetical protein